MALGSPESAGSPLAKAAVIFLSLLAALAALYVGSALLFADLGVFRNPHRPDALHPMVLFNAVLMLVLSYTTAATWLGVVWAWADFQALRPVIDAGDAEWEALARRIRRPAPRPVLRAALGGATCGVVVSLVSWALSHGDLPHWPGHRVAAWVLNPVQFAMLGALAHLSRGAHGVFFEIGRRARARSSDRSALLPFARNGLRLAFLWLLGSSLAALLMAWTDTPGVVLASIFVTAGLGVFSLFGPSRGVHLRMQEAKRDELAWVRAEIERAASALRDGASGATVVRLPALLAWEARVAAAPEWPFDTSTWLRFSLLLLVPLGSWLGGALAERFVERWLGA